MSVFSYDPSEDDEDVPAPKKRATARQRRTGPKKPRNWLPVSARDEDPDNPDHEPQPLTDDQRRRLSEQCMNLCLWHLGQGPRTEKQLREAMAKHCAPEDIINATVEKLSEYNYVNDAQFAENYVRSRTVHHRKGSLAIRRELQRKGVAQEQIAEALETVDEDTEIANARALVAKKLPSSRGLDRQKRVNRLVGMLARKGYHGGIAFQVVREALDAEDPEDEDYTPL